MPELLGFGGGYAGTFVGLGGGMPETLWAQGRLCRNFCGLGGGAYAGTIVGLGGGMPELLWAERGVCRNLCGRGGGLPELLGA